MTDMRTAVLALLFSVTAMSVFPVHPAASLANKTQAMEAVKKKSCTTDQANGLGCVYGTVVDTRNNVVKHIEVELIPTFKAGDARWFSTQHQWTDESGRYEFDRLQAGEYLVAVHHETAPDEHFPFASTYYPGVEKERDAGWVTVVASSPTALAPLRLRRLKLTSIAIEVLWSDGTRPARSNLLFHNESYPDQAVIGDVAPQINDGRGQFTLPIGFRYIASATVHCDAGRVIESRESNRIPIDLSDDPSPSQLIFVVPGEPCTLWSPQPTGKALVSPRRSEVR